MSAMGSFPSLSSLNRRSRTLVKGFPSQVIAHELALNAEALKGYAGFGDVFLDHEHLLRAPSSRTLDWPMPIA